MSIFGLKVIPKPAVLRPRPFPKVVDVRGPGSNTCGRIARHPNECYNALYYDYVQKKRMYEDDYINLLLNKTSEEAIQKKYMKHNEHKAFQRILNKKVNHKLEEYEEKIEERRKKLSDIIWKEERELLKEILEKAQQSKLERMEERTEKLKTYKTQKEAERQETARKLKLQQYLGRCAEFRPAIIKQRMNESKQDQLIQIKENESKKKSEAEFEHFWHQMKLKYCEAIDEREEQDRLKREKLINEFKFYAELQTKQKIGEEQKKKQEMLADRARLDKLRKDLEEEDRLFKQEQRKKKKDLKHLFIEQIEEKNKMLDQIASKELKIQRTYDKLADEEIERERAAIKAKVSTANEDMHKFQKYLSDLKKQREEEERNAGKVLQETMKAIQKEAEDKKCKEEFAKQALKKVVMKERENQIALHRKRDEEVQKAFELEQKLEKESREHTNRLRLEYERQNLIAAKQYREDLKQQMAYSNMLKDREKENMKKILDAAAVENETYDKIVSDVLSGKVKISETHPFRQVILSEKCPCLKPNY